MKCPLCGKTDDKVIESRQNQSATMIRRRRECIECGYRFTSYEHIEEIPIMVIKRSGHRERFDLKKTEYGVKRALEKRPIPHKAIEEMLHAIEDEAAMVSRFSNEIRSKTIGNLVLKRLFNLDKIAYVRFALVYRDFEDIDEFIGVVGHPEDNGKEANEAMGNDDNRLF